MCEASDDCVDANVLSTLHWQHLDVQYNLGMPAVEAKLDGHRMLLLCPAVPGNVHELLLNLAN
jgi:hypothetical protein